MDLRQDHPSRPTPWVRNRRPCDGTAVVSPATDDGDALERMLDLFMFREIRGAVEQVLGIKVSNGNAG